MVYQSHHSSTEHKKVKIIEPPDKITLSKKRRFWFGALYFLPPSLHILAWQRKAKRKRHKMQLEIYLFFQQYFNILCKLKGSVLKTRRFDCRATYEIQSLDRSKNNSQTINASEIFQSHNYLIIAFAVIIDAIDDGRLINETN